MFLTLSYSWSVQFVDDACYQIEKYERNVRQVGVVPYIPRSVLCLKLIFVNSEKFCHRLSMGIHNYVYLNLFIFLSII